MNMTFDPFRELDRAMGALAETRQPNRPMPIDLHREGDTYVLAADLPGIDPGSVDIDVSVARNSWFLLALVALVVGLIVLAFAGSWLWQHWRSDADPPTPGPAGPEPLTPRPEGYVAHDELSERTEEAR